MCNPDVAKHNMKSLYRCNDPFRNKVWLNYTWLTDCIHLVSEFVHSHGILDMTIGQLK